MAATASFEQAIEQDAVVEVGAIPEEKHQVRIELSSDSDVDIQLIDQETQFKIIAYPDGLLGGEDGNAQACATWNEVEYCYSGWDGDQTPNGKGNEWITIAWRYQPAIDHEGIWICGRECSGSL